MNELDLTTKIEGLKKAIAEHKDFAGTYESQLAETEQKLKDYNKIALPPTVFDDIYEAVDDAVCQYDFNDASNFNIEYGIEYDGKVYCESHEISDTRDLTDMIVEEVSKIFTEAECPEDKEAEELSDELNK